jgi:hypothetical protein
VKSLLGASFLAVSIGSSLGAPLQCGSGSEPSVRREDSAGDALYGLAQDFRAKGNEAAAQDTLRYLVDHYPSNRHVPAARAELGMGAGGAASTPPAASSAASSAK